MFADTLAVVGLAIVSLGTIQEAEGVQERTFCLYNAGSTTVEMHRGYTSCGCTSIHYDQARLLAPGDTIHVTLRFNPRGKGGEFHERGTVVYGEQQHRLLLGMDGQCVASDESLARQYPIRLSDHTWLSCERFDLGRMARGARREVSVAVLHRDENDRREVIPITFVADEKKPSGVQHVPCTLTTQEGGRTLTFTVTLDVLVQ